MIPFATLSAAWDDPDILGPLHAVWRKFLELRGEPISACEASEMAFVVDWQHYEITGKRLIPKAPWRRTGCGSECASRRIWLIPDGQSYEVNEPDVRYAYFPGMLPLEAIRPGAWAVEANIPGRRLLRYESGCDDLPKGRAALYEAGGRVFTWASAGGVWWCVDGASADGVRQIADAIGWPQRSEHDELRSRLADMGVQV